jgi:hypothetical protein
MSEPYGLSVIDAGAVLDEANAAIGSAWRLDSKMAGGLQTGAWRVRDGATAAVFKWHDPASDVPRNPDCAAVVDHIRSRGYPTPRWLASGFTETGFGWSIQELAAGERVMGFAVAAAERVIGLVELQRTITPPTTLSWSDFVRGKTGTNVDLPDDELVHCDFNVSNILVHDGRVAAVVDIDAAGRGCAAYDALAMRASVLPFEPDSAAIAMIEEYVRDTYDAATVEVISACIEIERREWLTKRRALS